MDLALRMRFACDTLPVMGKMLQIRNVPPRLHAELARPAKAAGKTLTGYVEEVLEREVAPTAQGGGVRPLEPSPPRQAQPSRV